MVSIIILINTQEDVTKRCIDSIEKYTPKPYELILISAIPCDINIENNFKVRSKNIPIKIIENKNILSYAKACNQGIRESSGKVVVILQDAIVTEDWLSGLIEPIASLSDIGIVGPMTNNAHGIQKVSDSDYQSLDDYYAYAKVFRENYRYRRIPAIKLDEFCLVFTRELIDDIGLFDENYKSDDFAVEDYCLRTSVKGYQNIIAGDVYVHREESTLINRYIDDPTIIESDKMIFNEKWHSLEEKNQISENLSVFKIKTITYELYQRGYIQEAIDILREGVKKFPHERKLLYALADIFIENKQHDAALKVIENLPESLRDSKYYELVGYCKEGLRLYEEADKYADKAILLHNKSSRAWNLKSIIAFNRGFLSESEKYSKKALEFDSGSGEVYSHLSTLRWHTDNKKEALNLIERAFMLSPTVAHIATSYYTAIMNLSRFEKGEFFFKNAISLYPLNKRLKYLLGDILLKQGKYKETMTVIEEAMLDFGIDNEILSLALTIRQKIGAKEIDNSQLVRDTISLCMIVKNEENTIARCLMSIRSLVDEMIVVDTGSADRTKEIALAYGAKVYDFPWTNNFSEARNYGLSKASGKWILILDADEVISLKDHEVLKRLIKSSRYQKIAYSFTTRNYVPHVIVGWIENDGLYREEAGTGWFPGEKVRLFPNMDGAKFENLVHELVEPSLKREGIVIKKCDIPIHHYGKLNRGKTVTKGESYYELGKIKYAEKKVKDARAIYELAMQATELEKHAEALEWWKQLIDIEPNSPKVYYFLGNSYFRLGKYEDAISSFKKSLVLEPETQDTIILYAQSAICAGKPEEAISYIEKLLKKNPSDPLGLAMLAIACFCMNRQGKGMECLQKLSAMNFSYINYFADFSKILITAGKKEYAEMLKCVLENNDENKAIPRLMNAKKNIERN